MNDKNNELEELVSMIYRYCHLFCVNVRNQSETPLDSQQKLAQEIWEQVTKQLGDVGNKILVTLLNYPDDRKTQEVLKTMLVSQLKEDPDFYSSMDRMVGKEEGILGEVFIGGDHDVTLKYYGDDIEYPDLPPGFRPRSHRRKSKRKTPDEKEDDVHFTALYPRQLQPGNWQSLLTYIHILSASEEIAADSNRFFNQDESSIGKSQSQSTRVISRGTEITVVPELLGCTFNPPVSKIIWMESWHRIEFRVRAEPYTEFQIQGIPTTGRISYYVGPLLVAETKIWAEILENTGEPLSGVSMGQDSTDAYRAIFVSYSHKDVEIVEQLSKAYKALGMSYLRDVESLRSGEKWNQALLKMIESADIFQLYWSNYAANSKYVEQEWRYALSLERKNFIRPVFWEKPIPSVPKYLSHLHFAKIDLE